MVVHDFLRFCILLLKLIQLVNALCTSLSGQAQARTCLVCSRVLILTNIWRTRRWMSSSLALLLLGGIACSASSSFWSSDSGEVFSVVVAAVLAFGRDSSLLLAALSCRLVFFFEGSSMCDK